MAQMVSGSGLFCDDTALQGYEIHMGDTELGEGMQPLTTIQSRNGDVVTVCDGAVSADGLVAGTYIHGLFDSGAYTRRLLNRLRQRKGLQPLADDVFDYVAYKDSQFELLADELEKVLDVEQLERIMNDFPLTLAEDN